MNFNPPSVLNIGRWLIKNIMLMGYILGGLFQTWNSAFPASQIVFFFNANEAVRSGDLGMGGQGKAFLKAALPPREMPADPQPQSMVCVLGDCLERTAKPASDLHGLFQT